MERLGVRPAAQGPVRDPQAQKRNRVDRPGEGRCNAEINRSSHEKTVADPGCPLCKSFGFLDLSCCAVPDRCISIPSGTKPANQLKFLFSALQPWKIGSISWIPASTDKTNRPSADQKYFLTQESVNHLGNPAPVQTALSQNLKVTVCRALPDSGYWSKDTFLMGSS